MRRLLGILVLVLATSHPVAAQKATQFEIEESLTCQCGCGLTVHSCNHLNCSSGEPIKAEIAERLARGEDKTTILAAFQSKFGEEVLSAPTFRGFNWLAWTVPLGGVLLATLVLAFVIRRRVGTPTPATALPAGGAGGDDALRARLQEELTRYDEDA